MTIEQLNALMKDSMKKNIAIEAEKEAERVAIEDYFNEMLGPTVE